MNNTVTFEQKKQNALRNAAIAAAARDEAIRKLRAIPARTDTMYVPQLLFLRHCSKCSGFYTCKSGACKNKK